MVYDPMRHHRRSIRLANYDYRQEGAYYITICTHERECLFGEIGDGEMRLNEYGEIILACWEAIPDHFPQADVDAFVVMPNHVHGILVIAGGNARAEGRKGMAEERKGMAEERKGMACHAPTVFDDAPVKRRFAQPVAGSLATILGAFKSAASRRINAQRETPGWTVWHRNYYEQIIPDEHKLENARRYIGNNPARWAKDVNNPANLTPLTSATTP